MPCGHQYLNHLLFSSVESLRAVPSPVNPCRLLYDFRRLDRFSCCISSNVGAGLKTVLGNAMAISFSSHRNEMKLSLTHQCSWPRSLARHLNRPAMNP